MMYLYANVAFTIIFLAAVIYMFVRNKSPTIAYVLFGALAIKLLYGDYLVYKLFDWTGDGFQAVFGALTQLSGRI